MSSENQAKVQGEKKRSLGKTFSLVAILTVLSKFAGLARDMVIASSFGLAALDPYNYAYLLTGNILILFGGLGGPFHSATVAILTPRKNDESAGPLMAQVFVLTIAVLLLIAAAAFVLAPYLIQLVAPAANVETTTMHLRIMVPLIVLSGIVGLSYGILNVYDKVFWPSLSPALASIAIIVAAVFFRDNLALCLAIGTLVGAIAQALAQLPGIVSSPLKWKLTTTPQPGLKDYATMLWPATISTSIGQLNIYIDSFFTSQIKSTYGSATPLLTGHPAGGAAQAAPQHETAGPWSAIVNANRLVQLPLGILLTAMLVPILPIFTEQVAAQRIDDLKAELRKALRFLWFLALPMAALLLALPRPIIQLLFERGRFTADDTEMMVAALLFLAPSIFFYVARDLITRVFYAHQDSKTPYHIALAAIVVHLILDLILVGPLGIAGIALATTLVTVFNLTCLTYFIRKKIGVLGFSRLVVPVCTMLGSSFICGMTAFHAQHYLQYMLSTSINLAKPLALLLSIGIAGVLAVSVYGILCVAFKLEEPSKLINRVLSRINKRRAGRD